ncbi:hypothetical protein [Microcoleus sp. AT3-D2]
MLAVDRDCSQNPDRMAFAKLFQSCRSQSEGFAIGLSSPTIHPCPIELR